MQPNTMRRFQPGTLAVALLCSLAATQIHADEAGELRLLRQQLEALQQRVEQMERQLAQAVQRENTTPASGASDTTTTTASAAGQYVRAGDIKHSIKLPGSNTSLSLGGYAKLDLVYNSAETTASYVANQVYVPGLVPLDSQRSGEKGQMLLSARETRLWFKSFTPATAYGDLTTYAEIDFLGSDGTETTGNSHGPRLRHAYGRLGNFLAGQTAPTLLNLASIPETSDQGEPIGYVLLRQPLVQYTHPMGKDSWQVALENPETTLATVSDGTATRMQPADDRYPDMVLRRNWERDWGQVSLAGMARNIRADGTVVAGNRDEHWGGVVALAGQLKINERDRLRFNLMYGNAVGRYMGNNFFNDGYVSPAGDITLINEWGGYASYQHWWTSTLRSNWTLGYARADNPAPLQGTTANRLGWSSHLNLVWSPLPQVTLFTEWLHAYREQEDGQEGDLDRLLFSGKYEF